MKRDLSIIIPARNEIFLKQTIDNILQNRRGNTEIIAICDGYWPDPPIQDHTLVTIVHHSKPIGQRAATNEGARMSQSKYIMKVDAHCAFDEGFDKKLMQNCDKNWIMVPMMWNLHAFDWQCNNCGLRTYQGVQPDECEACGKNHGHEMVMIWERRGNKVTVSWRFDENMQFQYWRDHQKRPENQGDLIESMSFIGACFFTHREYFWELEGLDEKHGSWGQFGTELACKTWLYGGKLITSKKTWFAHLFRTGNFKGSGWKGGSFPYKLTTKQQNFAKEYSQDLWLNDKWPKAKHKLEWLVDKFKPVPGWHEC